MLIVGPPRSGTSVMGRILGLHSQVETWIEPYFVWDRDFKDAQDDCRTRRDATPVVRKRIRDSFEEFRRALAVTWVVDKSPRSCLRVPFVMEVFPEARYLFLVRDGRDSVLSMARQWATKKSVVDGLEGGKDTKARIGLLMRWLRRQPLWRYRLRALLFEIGSPREFLEGGFLSRRRWAGSFGWGPRFQGWADLMGRVSELEFAAHQWLHCAQGVLQGLRMVPQEQRLLVRYEDFISDHEEILKKIFSFLGLELPPGFMQRIPKIMSKNAGKWQREFSKAQLRQLGPIIQKTLWELGYAQDEDWFQGLDS